MLLTNDNVSSENASDEVLQTEMDNQQGLVQCAVCGFEGISLQSHIRTHNLDGAEYKKQYNAPLVGGLHKAQTSRSIATRKLRYGSGIAPTTRVAGKKRVQELIGLGEFSGQLESVKAQMKLFGRDKPNPMHNPESARRNHSHSHSAPNWYERWILTQAPSLQFVGDFKLKVQHPTLPKCKYPDFTLPGTNLLVEMFSAFWHSRRFKGVDAQQHEQEVWQFYTECGYECLIIWSTEIKSAPAETIEKLTKFLRDYQERVGAKALDYGIVRPTAKSVEVDRNDQLIAQAM